MSSTCHWISRAALGLLVIGEAMMTIATTPAHAQQTPAKAGHQIHNDAISSMHQYDPGRQNAVARPTSLPHSDLTNAFVPHRE